MFFLLRIYFFKPRKIRFGIIFSLGLRSFFTIFWGLVVCGSFDFVSRPDSFKFSS